MTISSESVQKLLKSDKFNDRITGINQLRQLEVSVAFELIQPVLTDGNARVRYAAISQLDTLGHQDLSATLAILRDRLFNDSEPDVQAAAADVLGALKLTEAFEDLQQLYHQTPEWLVQFSIIATLGELGDARAFPLLEEAIASSIELVQTAAISSLGELGDPRAIAILIPFATNPDWQIRYRLVQALARLGGTEARSTLETLANDPVEQVASEAKHCLAVSYDNQ
ncbi:MAG TPA: phycocyanin alpha phycocyanobilin lyase [Cyanobacteria bacterium UBA11149]|nr:phycocyanin alpha phycocyanobilin lyase [Cyanobacteria bacterium UBA11367]HBE59671.1 phycocyanin alpha phycocyanobilin lyase [Cyanobacteria bacterium UBA11366]HBK64977.1 phycocyanin alpha phycocyanobilin lyase [Cyanobacteria bacterium UBA11166]HBR75902.1 phycocyanin alpha phycocyanobilin lyase [Cyanobacteria bacterium UBA11159]HBS68078.1 phycocyanin alpha phycocyanobilin lyase [Cyanobacteria bacterium UBA11153]HBW88043.1 phycocyanin alpha phycocyanobilin lyase [Cyanobacteria bacterium UBA11